MKCSNCNGSKWVQDPDWRWWKCWRDQFILCHECHGLNPPPEPVAETPSGGLLDSLNEMFDYFDDVIMEGRAEASQYTETIGLDGQVDQCYVADTESGECVTYIRYVANKVIRNIREQIVGPPEHVSNNRCCDDPTHGGIPVPDDITEELIKYGEAGIRGATAGESLRNAMRKITDEQGKRVLDALPAHRQAVLDKAKRLVKTVSEEAGVSDGEVEALLAEQILKCSQMGTSLEGVKEGLRKITEAKEPFSFEPLPAGRDAVPKPYAGYTGECGTLRPEED